MSLQILILGDGNAQLDAINLCRELGLVVHACANIERSRAKCRVDYFSLIDITDIEKILAYVERHHIDYVYSIGSDIAMPAASTVCERLGLPRFISSSTAQLCSNKLLLRNYLGADFRGNLEFQEVNSVRDPIKIVYPLVMKPSGSQGQRGVYKLDSEYDFNRHFQSSFKHDRNGKLILEDYIDGPELSVHAYVVNGVIIFTQISDRVAWEQFPGGVIRFHRIPSLILKKETESAVLDLIQRVIKKVSIENGPVYFQIKLKGFEPKLIEVTPRLDGCHLWRLIKFYTEIDLLRITFEHLIGKEPAADRADPNHSPGMRLEYFCQKPGLPVQNGKYDIARKDLLYSEFYYSEGEITPQVNGWYEKVGYCIRYD